MISKDCLMHLRRLAGVASYGRCNNGPHRQATRSMATVTDMPHPNAPHAGATLASRPSTTRSPDLIRSSPGSITTTIYSFPTMEPLHFAYYPQLYLHLPLRKDILHKAVVYEGDMTRQGTASTKWRDDVHGSHHKHHQQKGTGMARAGDKQSPIRRGGGVAFGPKPRDFSSGLNRKVYDLAFRTALSYRYRRGQLFLVDKIQDLQSPQNWFMRKVFAEAGLKGSMFITASKVGNEALFKELSGLREWGKIRETIDVDVKNLLEGRRIVIEKDALDRIFRDRHSDLGTRLGMVSSELPPATVFENLTVL